MQILNIAAYRFTPLNDLEDLRLALHKECDERAIKGTILLSSEGINLSLAGTVVNIDAFKSCLNQDTRFSNMSFHESYSDVQPFRKLKVKLKKEIITLRHPDANPIASRGAALSPEEFKQWLDEKRDITILDTRNDYEIRFGTFDNALNLHVDNFGELPAAAASIEKDKPIVMFCTGGIRCEKAAIYMQRHGYSDVYQLDGGILGYFAKVGGAHYHGECFVFDERTAVDSNLQVTGTVQCRVCHGPVTRQQQQSAAFIPGVSCPTCATA